MELRLGAQYNFMSFSLQEEGGWSVGEGGGERGSSGGKGGVWRRECGWRGGRNRREVLRKGESTEERREKDIQHSANKLLIKIDFSNSVRT